MTINLFITAIISGLVGFIPTYLAAILKYRKELESEYDKDLRNKRIEAYKVLWCHLQPLAKYARIEPFSYNKVNTLLVDLRKWYFENGGIYLTENSRDRYFDLMDELQKISLSNNTKSVVDQTNREIIEFDGVRELGSLLRTDFTRDIGTRRDPKLGYD
jgi:hypothetical protein